MASTLRDHYLELPRAEARTPPAGEVLFADMIGLAVCEAQTGKTIGLIKAIVSAGQELLEVAAAGGDLLIPWVPEFVKDIDLTAGTVSIHSIPGLLDP
ncbi:MAG: PRC-barrel domain-containing protein [Cyanobacteria bacterium NC_groundwater_1444_Ag_S-0.65um_54_12]|nr:PRC-barrel domain-containing protein [Cyanobacteria bacterium NC_groundwater_1444_Ag_S-0.65um_54_12]